VEDLMEEESGQLSVVSGQSPPESAETGISAEDAGETVQPDLAEDLALQKLYREKRRRRRPRPVPADPPPAESKVAAAAIETLAGGRKIECTATAYRRTIRDALERYALRLSDAGRSEECSAVLAEVRRLDGLFGD
jgi:hypothetical protein